MVFFWLRVYFLATKKKKTFPFFLVSAPSKHTLLNARHSLLVQHKLLRRDRLKKDKGVDSLP